MNRVGLHRAESFELGTDGQKCSLLDKKNSSGW